MDFIIGYILTNHKDLMEFIFERFDIRYVKNRIYGISAYNQYQYGEIQFTQDERNLVFVENYWVNGQKVENEDIMTYVRIGDFGIGRDIIESLINHFGGCVKNEKGLLFFNNINKSMAKDILKGLK